MKNAGRLIIFVGLLILGLFLIFRPPSIPHSLEGTKECVTCHGSNGIRPYPTWHEELGYGNDDCSSCHHLNSENRTVTDAITK